MVPAPPPPEGAAEELDEDAAAPVTGQPGAGARDAGLTGHVIEVCAGNLPLRSDACEGAVAVEADSALRSVDGSGAATLGEHEEVPTTRSSKSPNVGASAMIDAAPPAPGLPQHSTPPSTETAHAAAPSAPISIERKAPAPY